MGSYTFKWEHPEASKVYVTGTFDDWGKTQELDKLPSGFFSKTVKLPKAEKTLYKFVVDDDWTTNTHLPIEKDEHGNENNVLQASEIIPETAAIATVGAAATTLGLAGAVPKEGQNGVPGAFPETPANEPSTFSVNPIPATAGAGNPIHLKPGEPVPDPSTLTSNTISSTAKDDPELVAAGKAAEEPTFSVNPIPATAGAGNPVSLKPGEPVPDPSTLTGNTVQSTVKLDEASYNASDASAAVVPPAGATGAAKEAEVNPAEAGMFGVPPVSGTMIPESSLPMGEGATSDSGPGAGILTSTVGAGSTTAALAGQVPKEERGVPEVVSESQQAAHVDPEASANPVAVEEKKEVEDELKSKVPEEAPTSGATTTEKVTAAVTGAAAAAGATAAGVAALAHEKATSAVSGTPKVEESVPEVVKESIAEAHTSPEAAANPVAVEEKSAVEKELESKIKPSEASGEPAPTVTAATTDKAPEPTPSTPAKNGTDATPATPASVAESSTASPADAAKTDKKSKRKSILKKLKHLFD